MRLRYLVVIVIYIFVVLDTNIDLVQKASSGEIVACRGVTLRAIVVSLMLSTLVKSECRRYV